MATNILELVINVKCNLDLALNYELSSLVDAAIKRSSAEMYNSMLDDLIRVLQAIGDDRLGLALEIKELIPFKLDANGFLVKPEIPVVQKVFTLLDKLIKVQRIIISYNQLTNPATN